MQLYQANVPLVLVPNATHNATAWRGALRPLFSWMTPQLTHQAQFADEALAASRRAKAKAKSRHVIPGLLSPSATTGSIRRGKQTG